jgi:tetratricopeptide (TPR) repeat protein
MSEIPLPRRFAIAAIAIAIAAWMLRGQMADALVTRGDEWLYRAMPRRALQYYRRAVWLDAGDAAAVDRFAFASALLHDKRAAETSIAFSTAYMARHPRDTVVRMDRAMAERAIGSTKRALADFAAVGLQTHDARAFVFAGHAARMLGEVAYARNLLHAALALQPFMPAALHELARAEAKR